MSSFIRSSQSFIYRHSSTFSLLVFLSLAVCWGRVGWDWNTLKEGIEFISAVLVDDRLRCSRCQCCVAIHQTWHDKGAFPWITSPPPPSHCLRHWPHKISFNLIKIQHISIPDGLCWRIVSLCNVLRHTLCNYTWIELNHQFFICNL
jgi:hypothetical protein